MTIDAGEARFNVFALKTTVETMDVRLDEFLTKSAFELAKLDLEDATFKVSVTLNENFITAEDAIQKIKNLEIACKEAYLLKDSFEAF